MPIAGIYGPDDFGNRLTGIPPRRPRSRVSAAERARALPMPSLEWTPEVERATAHLYERVRNVISPVEWPFMAPYIKAINELKQDPRRGDPGAQLPDAGDFPLRRRHRRRLAAARDRSHQGEVRHHRAVRRALHGGDLEDPEPEQDGSDPGFARRLFAGLEHHGRGRAAVARTLSRRAGGGLCQHLGRREGGGRHLLHLLQRGAGGREPQCADGDLPAGPVSGEICRLEDRA